MAVQFETQQDAMITLEEMTHHGQMTMVVFVRHLG